MLYVDAAVLQVGLYVYNRRHNVSPHEAEGSSGLAGMIISALTAPIYVSSLVAAVLRRKGGFVTTPKGDAVTSADRSRHVSQAPAMERRSSVCRSALSFLLGQGSSRDAACGHSPRSWRVCCRSAIWGVHPWRAARRRQEHGQVHPRPSATLEIAQQGAER